MYPKRMTGLRIAELDNDRLFKRRKTAKTRKSGKKRSD
jgi:hypothetical protein